MISEKEKGDNLQLSENQEAIEPVVVIYSFHFGVEALKYSEGRETDMLYIKKGNE